MQVAGVFRPPSIGMRVDPYPISGPGTVEVKDGAVHIEGDRGIPWQVEVGGMLGLIAGIAISALVLRPFGATLTAVGIMAGIVLGSAAGYRWAGNKIRARHRESFESNALVDVSATENEVLITISFRKRFQTRKQCIHFRPDDAAKIPELTASVTAVLVQKAA